MTTQAYIYGLYDYSGIRYVGKTIRIKKRLSDHIYEARNPKSKLNHRINWIRKLLKNNEKPQLKILETCEESVCSDRERRWVLFGTLCGWKLTNSTDGGEIGHHFSAESRQKQSVKAREIMLERLSNPEFRKKFKEKMTAACRTDEFRKMRSQLSKQQWDQNAKNSKSKEVKQYFIEHPEAKQRLSETTKQQWKNQEYRTKMSNPERARKIAEGVRRNWEKRLQIVKEKL